MFSYSLPSTQKYTCPEVRIPFDIPHNGCWAYTTLSVAIDPIRKTMNFEKILAYTSCPQESVVFYEKVPISFKDAWKECEKDQKCNDFVNSYLKAAIPRVVYTVER